MNTYNYKYSIFDEDKKYTRGKTVSSVNGPGKIGLAHPNSEKLNQTHIHHYAQNLPPSRFKKIVNFGKKKLNLKLEMLKLIKETLQDAGIAVKDFLNRIPLAKEQWPTIDFQRPSQLQKQAHEEETHKMRDNFLPIMHTTDD